MFARFSRPAVVQCKRGILTNNDFALYANAPASIRVQPLVLTITRRVFFSRRNRYDSSRGSRRVFVRRLSKIASRNSDVHCPVNSKRETCKYFEYVALFLVAFENRTKNVESTSTVIISEYSVYADNWTFRNSWMRFILFLSKLRESLCANHTEDSLHV